jgi:transcriptional regulator with XRE-family HTH domain
MTVSNTIGDRIRKLREKRNETQAELASELHVKRETVNQWENGTRDIKTQYTISLANHFETTCDYLLGVSPNQTNNADILNICERTGLSEGAYNAILKINSETHPFPSDKPIKRLDYVFDELVQNELFYQLLNQIEFITSQFDIYIYSYDLENGLHMETYDVTTEATLYRLQKSIDTMAIEIARKINEERKDLIEMIRNEDSKYIERYMIEKG